MSKTDKPKKAERLARAIASDLSIYYQQKIQEGLENDNLFEVLEEELKEGRDLFRARVADELIDTTNIFEKAIIDIIVAPRSNIHTRIF